MLLYGGLCDHHILFSCNFPRCKTIPLKYGFRSGLVSLMLENNSRGCLMIIGGRNYKKKLKFYLTKCNLLFTSLCFPMKKSEKENASTSNYIQTVKSGHNLMWFGFINRVQSKNVIATSEFFTFFSQFKLKIWNLKIDGKC